MKRYTLTVVFEVADEHALTAEEMATASDLMGEFLAEDGLPAGTVTDVSIAEASLDVAAHQKATGNYRRGNDE